VGRGKVPKKNNQVVVGEMGGIAHRGPPLSRADGGGVGVERGDSMKSNSGGEFRVAGSQKDIRNGKVYAEVK